MLPVVFAISVEEAFTGVTYIAAVALFILLLWLVGKSRDKTRNDGPYRVDTYPAGAFVCISCERVSYFDLLAAGPDNVSEEEKKEFDKSFSDAYTAGALYKLPADAECQHCGAEHELFTPYVYNSEKQ